MRHSCDLLPASLRLSTTRVPSGTSSTSSWPAPDCRRNPTPTNNDLFFRPKKKLVAKSAGLGGALGNQKKHFGLFQMSSSRSVEIPKKTPVKDLEVG